MKAIQNDYRSIAEKYFNKRLGDDEVVHHMDGNHDNNDPENLVIMKRSQHSKLHGDLYSGLNEWRKRGKICKNCLFVSLYETGKENLKDVLFDLANDMLENVKRTDKSLDIIYSLSKKWKEENNHDCYELKNMQVTK